MYKEANDVETGRRPFFPTRHTTTCCQKGRAHALAIEEQRALEGLSLLVEHNVAGVCDVLVLLQAPLECWDEVEWQRALALDRLPVGMRVGGVCLVWTASVAVEATRAIRA